jgi:hypothetical protein
MSLFGLFVIPVMSWHCRLLTRRLEKTRFFSRKDLHRSRGRGIRKKGLGEEGQIDDAHLYDMTDRTNRCVKKINLQKKGHTRQCYAIWVCFFCSFAGSMSMRWYGQTIELGKKGQTVKFCPYFGQVGFFFRNSWELYKGPQHHKRDLLQNPLLPCSFWKGGDKFTLAVIQLIL